jgi:hypothetical protein
MELIAPAGASLGQSSASSQVIRERFYERAVGWRNNSQGVPMSRRFAWSAWVIGFAAALTTSICGASDGESQRRFQVRDSIEMAQFAEPGLISPDERYIATLTKRGRIEQNVTEGTLWLFDTHAVRQAINQPHPKAVEPTVLVRMSASINGCGVLTRVMWESGSDHLLFLGCNGSENRQLYRVNLLDHKLTVLSLPTQDVVDYAISDNHIVYLAGPDVAPEKAWWSNDPSAPDIVVGDRRSIWETLFPNYRRNTPVHANPIRRLANRGYTRARHRCHNRQADAIAREL